MLGCVAALFVCACGEGPPPPRSPVTASTSKETVPTPSAARPRVVIAIVIDQFAAWIAADRLKELPSMGGFARLQAEGAYYRDMRFEHAVTDTAPGHAALFSGATPRDSGIYSNERIDRNTKAHVSIVKGEEATRIGEKGVAGKGAASLKVMRAETIGDKLRAAKPNAWISSISLKDRAAVFGGGKNPDVVLWHDSETGQFVTSSAFASTFPGFLEQGNKGLQEIRNSIWTVANPSWLKVHARTADNEAGEGNLDSTGITFPHRFDAAKGIGLRISPKSDELLLDLTLASLDEGVKQKRGVLYAAVSLSANDYIGHTFGPDSWEAWDELYRLDASIAKFLNELDRRFGADGYSVVLSGDHGIVPLPELQTRSELVSPSVRTSFGLTHEFISARIHPNELHKELETAARKALGPGNYILGVSEPFVYYTDDVHALSADKQLALWQAISQVLMLTPGRGFERVFLVSEDMRTGRALYEKDLDESRRLVFNGISKDVGDIYIIPKSGSFIETLYTPGKGTNHGSPQLFDRSVPLLVRTHHKKAAGKVYFQPKDFREFSRTLAELLEISPPAAALQRIE